jgi:hypothetical protein
MFRLDILKTATVAVEGVVVSTCAFAGYQVATAQGGSIWACAPLLTVAAIETCRVPVAMTIPKMKLAGQLLSVALLACVSVLTFEAMMMAYEQFMDQRVLEVTAADIKAETAQAKLTAAQNSAATRKTELDRLSAELKDAEANQAEIASQKPTFQKVPPAKMCPTYGWRGTGKNVRQIVVGSHECPDDGERNSIIAANTAEAKTYDAKQRAAQDAVTKARAALAEFAAKPTTDLNKVNDELAEAKGAQEKARSSSVMHRAAAAWFGIDPGELTADQFQTFKKWALNGLAGATATVTMILGFISNLSRKDDKPGKVGMAWRAYLARRRKKLVRVVEKLIPSKAITALKIKYVPFDPASGRVLHADGSLGEFVKPDADSVSSAGKGA